MSEGPDCAPQLMALLSKAKEFVKCKDDVASYFDRKFSWHWGMKLLLLLRGT
jgi:hypothetical protein